MKRCTKCKELLDRSCFNKRSSNKVDGLQGQCKKCNKINLKKHYSSRKDYYFGKNKLAKDSLREFVNSLKLSCASCSESETCCLDFHHVDSEQKEFSIANAIQRRFSKERLLEEISKCVVVCSNCHRKIHNGIIECPMV